MENPAEFRIGNDPHIIVCNNQGYRAMITDIPMNQISRNYEIMHTEDFLDISIVRENEEIVRVTIWDNENETMEELHFSDQVFPRIDITYIMGQYIDGRDPRRIGAMRRR